MIPTSTNVQVKVVQRVPAQAAAVAVMAAENGGPDEASVKQLDAEMRRAVSRLRDAGVVKGKAREVATDLVGAGKAIRRLLVVGLGDGKTVSANAVREAGGAIAKHARQNQLRSVWVVVPQVAGLTVEEVAGAMVEGFLLASFRYREYSGKAKKSGNSGADTPVALHVVAPAGVDAAVRRAVMVAEAQNFARTIAFRPGNDINPVTLATVVQKAAREVGLRCRVLDEKQLAREKMGGILAVGAGSSATPPRLIVLEHKPAKARGKPVLLVGKAITFDTGGISIKPAERMGRMVFDKCGGMAVMGAMVAIARLKLPVHVVGILAAAENHISERAYRPGDLLRMHNGVTVEVTNTDAEGRLVLGDAMAWGIKQYRPRACVDLATLTGGIIVALGKSMAGIMGNDQRLVDRLLAVGTGQGEKMWQLPMPEEPQEMLKSEYADIVNSGGRDAHPLQGAAFLSFFVPEDGEVAWAHLDIAGVADTERDLPLYSKGATGWGVRTLVRWLEEAG